MRRAVSRIPHVIWRKWHRKININDQKRLEKISSAVKKNLGLRGLYILEGGNRERDAGAFRALTPYSFFDHV
ncbi:hypothetical protein GOP47_0012265 [Adiantum capillus-veneris]|uniref:Uncharacterized protein n=1 Tax=Adiantum capillus-veneris TaxID=13818 RepID=A0A9D4ZEA3_ADICA|nr:hypothetical protein GOP47_0012265 [Adiantum capillus-veneris]